MIITLQKFQEQYGPGRPPIKGAFKNAIVNPDIEIPILTALVDHIGARRCLEIGCNTGATSAAILAGNKTIEAYIGVDLPKIWFADEPAGGLALPDQRFQLLQLEHGSKDVTVMPVVRGDPPYPAGQLAPVDFIFIDGNHEYAWVGYDSLLARRLLNPIGGIIAWHDYNHPGNPDVKRWIHETNDKNFIANNTEPRIVWAQGTTVCYQIYAVPQAAVPETPLNEPKPKRRGQSKSGRPKPTA